MCVNDKKWYSMYAFESVIMLGVVNGGSLSLFNSFYLLIILSWKVIRKVGVRGQRFAVGASRSVGRRGSAAWHRHQLGWASEQIVVGAGRRGNSTSSICSRSGAGSSSIRWASTSGAGNGCEGRNKKCDKKLHGTTLSYPLPLWQCTDNVNKSCLPFYKLQERKNCNHAILAAISCWGGRNNFAQQQSKWFSKL